MSIGTHKARPSSSQGSHPLVTSRSAPVLQSATSTETGRLQRPLRDSPSPERGLRLVGQLHPAVTSPGTSPPAGHDTPQDAKQPRGRAQAKEQPLPDTQTGAATGTLVRFVGSFILSPQAQLEEDNDVLTVLTDSIQRSVQQQPDSAASSSGEATPQTLLPSSQPLDDVDSPVRSSRSRLPGRDNTN